jgi:hypothetical protein
MRPDASLLRRWGHVPVVADTPLDGPPRPSRQARSLRPPSAGSRPRNPPPWTSDLRLVTGHRPAQLPGSRIFACKTLGDDTRERDQPPPVIPAERSESRDPGPQVLDVRCPSPTRTTPATLSTTAFPEAVRQHGCPGPRRAMVSATGRTPDKRCALSGDAKRMRVYSIPQTKTEGASPAARNAYPLFVVAMNSSSSCARRSKARKS